MTAAPNMKMNSLMRSHWQSVAAKLRTAKIGRQLRELVESPIVEVRGATVLQRLITPGQEKHFEDDLTRFEAFTNHIHVEDYLDRRIRKVGRLVQAFLYAEALASRLANTGRRFRILVGRDPDSDSVTVRFFLRRKGQPWNDEDLESYKIDAVAQWDV